MSINQNELATPEPKKMMGFGQAVLTCLKKYTQFSGSATRAEFWWFYLFNFITNFLSSIVANVIGIKLILLVPLFLLLPLIAVGVRRLHDINRNGWHYLLCILLPPVGMFVLLYWFLLKGTNENRVSGYKAPRLIIQLIIADVIVMFLVAVLTATMHNYQQRVYFGEIVKAAVPYKSAVVNCIATQKTATGCNAGTNQIPLEITQEVGKISKLTVQDGVITVTPVQNDWVVSTDTYILTPAVDSTGITTWSSSGDAINKGYAN